MNPRPWIFSTEIESKEVSTKAKHKEQNYDGERHVGIFIKFKALFKHSSLPNNKKALAFRIYLIGFHKNSMNTLLHDLCYKLLLN